MGSSRQQLCIRKNKTRSLRQIPERLKTCASTADLNKRLKKLMNTIYCLSHISRKYLKTSMYMNTLISEQWLPLKKEGRKDVK